MAKMPKSVRKFIRLEKSRIRRDVLDYKKQEEMIKEIYNRFNEKAVNRSSISAKEKSETHKRIGRL